MRKLLGLAACGIAIGMTAPVQADTKTADGLTYRLTAIALTSTEDQFTLTITGINGSRLTKKYVFLSQFRDSSEKKVS
jgi:hypothetical protein